MLDLLCSTFCIIYPGKIHVVYTFGIIHWWIHVIIYLTLIACSYSHEWLWRQTEPKDLKSKIYNNKEKLYSDGSKHFVEAIEDSKICIH